MVKLQFDVPGTSVPQVESYTFKLYVDGSKDGVVLQNVKAHEYYGYYVCVVDLPPQPAGSHTYTVTVADVNGESVHSSPVTVEADKTLPAPANVQVLGLRVHPPDKTAAKSAEQKKA